MTKTELDERLMSAMLDKNEASKRVLRSIKTKIMEFETAKRGKPADENHISELLKQMANQREESMNIYVKNGATELAAVEEEELTILKGFLPAELTRDELKEEVQKIKDLNPDATMGLLMREMRSKFPGRLDNKLLSQVVSEILSNK